MSKVKTATLFCDLCDKEMDYCLCQKHLDIMRFLDTYCTADGNYPEPGEMVLWDSGTDTYIGGYDNDCLGWFAQGDEGFDDEQENYTDVVWCRLPDLWEMYRQSKDRG